MTSKAKKPKSTYIRVSEPTKAAVEDLARRFRLTQARAAEVAIEAFQSLSPEQQRLLIDADSSASAKADAA